MSKKRRIKFSKATREKIYHKFGNQCFKCKSKENLSLDHHIPMSKGGKTRRNNVVVLCFKCNNKKDNLLPKEFYNKRELDNITFLLNIGKFRIKAK